MTCGYVCARPIRMLSSSGDVGDGRDRSPAPVGYNYMCVKQRIDRIVLDCICTLFTIFTHTATRRARHEIVAYSPHFEGTTCEPGIGPRS